MLWCVNVAIGEIETAWPARAGAHEAGPATLPPEYLNFFVSLHCECEPVNSAGLSSSGSKEQGVQRMNRAMWACLSCSNAPLCKCIARLATKHGPTRGGTLPKSASHPSADPANGCFRIALQHSPSHLIGRASHWVGVCSGTRLFLRCVA